MLFIQYPKCSTCQKAKKWLDTHNITYTDRGGIKTDYNCRKQFRQVKITKKCVNNL